jgi:hypothetical protein
MELITSAHTKERLTSLRKRETEESKSPAANERIGADLSYRIKRITGKFLLHEAQGKRFCSSFLGIKLAYLTPEH